jgi:hypothetical protein
MTTMGNGHARQVGVTYYRSVACTRGLGANIIKAWSDLPNDPNVGVGVCHNYDQTYSPGMTLALQQYLLMPVGQTSKP